MNAARMAVCAMAMCAASLGAGAANAQTPVVGQLASSIVGDQVRFDGTWADPTQPWGSTMNAPGGWMLVLFVAPNAGSSVEYVVPGNFYAGWPVLQVNHPKLFVLQSYPEDTPTTGSAAMQLSPSGFRLDVPVTALGGLPRGMRYSLQLFSLTPVDAQIVRIDLNSAHSGLVAGPSTDNPTQTAGMSWGAVKSRYR